MVTVRDVGGLFIISDFDLLASWSLEPGCRLKI
jgi:hypothetical protein